MNREQIIDLIDRQIDFTDMKKAGLALSKHYEVNTIRMESAEVKTALQKGHPVAIRGKLIIGYNPLKKAFETSDDDFLQIERPVEAIEIVEALPEREYFAITGRNEWGDISEYNSIIGGLRLGEIYLPKHSAIFNFLNPTDETKKEKIQSVLNGVQIIVYERENYVDNCLHEIGHLFWRTCTRFEEKMQFKELFKHLRESCIYEYKWERSSEEEVFCTIYKWYMKSILINKSFYNILEYEESYGLKLLQGIFDRIAKERIIEDIWEMSKEDVIEYLNPPLDRNSGKYIRKSGMLDKIKDIELPESVLNRIENVQNGQAFIGLGKAIVPVNQGMIDFEKAKDLSKLTRKQITDKRGHVRTVWVKTGQEEKKESKGSQIDTPEFKKWFGDSKVVDSQGKPLVVYHGTDKEFNEFKKENLGSAHGSAPANLQGFYFTNDIISAKSYGKKIKQSYLKIERPLILDAKGKNYSEFKHILNDKIDSIDKNKYDGIIVKNYKDAGKYSNKYIQSDQYIPLNTNQIKIINNSEPMQKAINLEKPTIFCDMDGCVTDFALHYKNLFNRDINKDDSFTVTEMCKTEPRFFLTIPVLQRGKELYDRLVKKYNVIFLTTAMDELEYCRADKVTWLKQNICEEPTIIFSANKSDYAHSEKDILIDDMKHNLTAFYENGGTAIDFNACTNDEILAKIAETLNPQAEIIQIKQQIKEMKVNTEPTEKQKESGIYQKGRFVIKGIPVVIENPKGSVRWGIGENGRKWFSKMKSHYGYIQHKGEAIDGDKVDVFIGDNFSNNKVFVVNQGFNNLFDEHKILLGFTDINTAKESYLACYEKGWEKNIISIIPTNTKKLKDWLKSGNMNEPYRD
jgi:5'(3')-deoxyribonucleotidase